jgi:hypothetical protein
MNCFVSGRKPHGHFPRALSSGIRSRGVLDVQSIVLSTEGNYGLINMETPSIQGVEPHD